MTNVTPSELNYDSYTDDKYDLDIVNSIPCHKELHEYVSTYIKTNFDLKKEYRVLDLGTGTGITAKLIQTLLPHAKIDAVDFSEQMIEGAKRKLGERNVRYILGDYADMNFDGRYDIVVSVIGIHHQNTTGKKNLFKKIYSLLNAGGVFIYGDLVTHRDPHKAARNNALHYHHLVEHASDEKTLNEWAHHHMFLNDLAPIEDQTEWLKQLGFRVTQGFLRLNTSLLFCLKGEPVKKVSDDMQDFLTEWENNYKKEAAAIPLFTEAVLKLSVGQKKRFVRLFYHARGHFYRFLWIMASLAPSAEYRSVIIRNIDDELGGLDESHVSHEQLFYKFAEVLDPNILEEAKTEINYLPFLREFDDGHVQALMNADWDEKWSIFCAYELLDNTDYNNLFHLAEQLGITGEALTFFDVHRHGDHFGETFQLLQKIWDTNPEIVKKGFEFIGPHQLKMWKGISNRVFV